MLRGRSSILKWGGAQKIMCVHYEYEVHIPYGWETRVLDALSCYLSLILEHSDTKWAKKKHG